jgi:hypothetical protein
MSLKIRKEQIKNSHRFYSTNLFGLPTTTQATRSLVKHKTGSVTHSSSYNYRALMENNFGNRLYSTVNDSSKNILNPYYVTGFADGESNFTILFTKNKTLKLGWRVQPSFQINLHKKDLNLLQELKSYWGVGEIYEQKKILVSIWLILSKIFPQ